MVTKAQRESVGINVDDTAVKQTTGSPLVRKARAAKEERDEIATKLDLVYNKALTFTKSEPELVAAIKDAGDNHEAIKKEIYVARVQVALGYTKAQSIKAIANPDRTIEEKKAYGAARSWVSTLFKKHGIETQETRGGARERKTHDQDEMDAGEIKFPKPPKVVTRFELQAWVFAQAQTMADFFALNEKHDTVDNDHGHALWGACKDFLTSIQEIGNEHTPSTKKEG